MNAKHVVLITRSSAPLISEFECYKRVHSGYLLMD